MEQTILLPNNSWKKLRRLIKLAGEGEAVSFLDAGDDYWFLVNLGIFDPDGLGELTPVGQAIFSAAFIKIDENEERDLLQQLILSFPPALAIQQYLWGIKDPTLDQVLTVLKSTNFWIYENTKAPLVHFLDFLNYVQLIKYNKKQKTISVILPPDTISAPKSIFIDPSRPYSNIFWIKKVLSEATGFIYWLDKHFQKEGLEWIWEAAKAQSISSVKILSLDLGEVNLNSLAKKDYKRLQIELANKGIKLLWHTVDSKLIRDAHDRWIIGGNGYARNVPNVNAINSGQKSELYLTDNYIEVLDTFNKYWVLSKEI